MADYRRLELLTRDPPAFPALGDDAGAWEGGDAAVLRWLVPGMVVWAGVVTLVVSLIGGQ